MEELLARERAAEQHVHNLLKTRDEPIANQLQAFDDYRQICDVCIFADFEHGAEKVEARLWHAHTAARKYFLRALQDLRKHHPDQQVTARNLIKLYLQFIKASQRFYRDYVYKLNVSFGGIPELEAVAQWVKADGTDESSQPSTSPELRTKVLRSCHQTLIYLGDLSRYRASDQLDKKPDFGPAIGYYSLACSLCPTSGMGHHQQAVVALEQRYHLHAIYHLYHAIVVENPHPNASNNLKLEFDKTNAAWDRGELIRKGPPNDPEGPKRALVGWFVRLHSMCVKGVAFKGYEELEREVLSQLATEIKERSLDSTLMRMLMVNLAAQFNAGEKFQADPTAEHQHAFCNFFRINIRTFTTLLQLFHDDMKTVDTGTDGDLGNDLDLTTRLTVMSRSILPGLRLYSSWLLSMVRLLAGLATDDFLKDAIDQLWTTFAKAVDVVAATFPIWDLEESQQVSYLLEEDVDTIGFKPLLDDKTKKVWYDKATGALKPRFSDHTLQRVSVDEEMLARVKDFLIDGVSLANDDDQAPIKLRGTRILHRDAVEDIEMPPPPAPRHQLSTTEAAVQQTSEPPATRKPLSYAAAAMNGQPQAPGPVKTPEGASTAVPSRSRHAQLSRMVDDLVDDDDGAGPGSATHPVTPPPQYLTNPAVVMKGDVSYSSLLGGVQDFTHMPNYSYQPKASPINSRPVSIRTPPAMRDSIAASVGNSMDSQSVSDLWNNPQPTGPVSSSSANFPGNFTMGVLGSPSHAMASHNHSRVNSTSSIRTRTSPTMNMNGVSDSWSSLETARSALPGLAGGGGGMFGGNSFTPLEPSGLARPLLFGASGSVWSTTSPTRPLSDNMTPPNGQGG